MSKLEKSAIAIVGVMTLAVLATVVESCGRLRLKRRQDIGTGKARRPLLTEHEEEEKEEDEWGRREIVKFIKKKTQNGVEDLDWEEISQVVREKIGNEHALGKWEEFNANIEEKIENGEDINWEEMMRLAPKQPRFKRPAPPRDDCGF